MDGSRAAGKGGFFRLRGWVSDPLTAVSLVIAAALVVLVGVRWHAYQWDFNMFVGAARDFAAGQSPYRGEGLSFFHPPVTLYFYWLFTLLPTVVGYAAWYLLKLGALARLLTIWHRDYSPLPLHFTTVFFLMLAYDGAIYADLVSGNVSIFEELVLWYGFASLLRGRHFTFGLCVVLAAQVKLTPLFFAGLFLVAGERPKWGAFFATLAGFAALFSLNQWLEPELFQRFWAASAQLDERGSQNASLLALVRDVSDRLLGAAATAASRLDEILYVAGALAVFAISWLFVARYRRAVAKPDVRLLIALACFVFALVSPRFKVYTCILLLAPTWYLVRSVRWREHAAVATVLLLVLVLLPQGHNLLPFRYAFQLFGEYITLVATLAMWIACLLVLAQLAGKPLLKWQISWEPAAPQPRGSAAA
jgi:hypothetical protein